MCTMRDNFIAGMLHLVHVDPRDLYDHVACPCLQTVQVHTIISMPDKMGKSGIRRSRAELTAPVNASCGSGVLLHVQVKS